MFTNGPLPQPTMHPPVPIDLLAAVVKTPVFFWQSARMNIFDHKRKFKGLQTTASIA